jgi:hypothetical protein
MIYLLGGSGYVGHTYQALLTRKGLPFRNLRRADFDYTNRDVLRAALLRRPARVPDQRRRLHRQAQRRCLRAAQAECLFGNAVLPGIIADACADAGVPWGHVSSGCIYTGSRPDGPASRRPTRPTSPSAPTTVPSTPAPRRSAKRCSPASPTSTSGGCASPSTTSTIRATTSPSSCATSGCSRPTNSISHLEEFCAATFACWEKRVPFGTLQRHQSRPDHHARGGRPDQARAASANKEFSFFKDEAEFMSPPRRRPAPTARWIPPNSPRRHHDDRSPRVHPPIPAPVAKGRRLGRVPPNARGSSSRRPCASPSLLSPPHHVNVLVTGGCGFIGSNFIRQRLARVSARPSPAPAIARQPRRPHLRRQPRQPRRPRR